MMNNSTSIQDWLYNCIRCGNCKYIFKDYSPSCPSGEYFHFESFFASGRLWLAHGIQKGELDWDSSLLDPIFACTTCSSCEIQCLAPHHEYIVDVIEELRALAVEALGPLEAHEKFAKRIQASHNPYGHEHHNRALLEIHNLPEKAPIVYFVGCTANYREEVIRDATISILKKTGIDFTIVDEYCCGSPLIRTGQIEQVNDLAEHNYSVFEQAGAKRILTSCSGCYRTLLKDYQKIGLRPDFEILHISQFVRELLDSGKLSLKISNTELEVTYHDPCHLGRHMNEYDAPREVLANLPITFREMEFTRENAWCCGSGGGCKSQYPEWSLETARKRITQAKSTKVSTLVSACPFCKRAFMDANDGSLDIIDLSEIVDRFTET
ncbi:MAG: (Fe-S)-binding protein [Candidatus Thorarchaeota archaeon]|nr:(Fe-S)-binding protein [Candidatus Thorarchaeota archaeon]